MSRNHSTLARIARSLLPLCAILLGACAGDRAHVMRVSVADQRMALYKDGVEVRRFPVSTSKFGVGDTRAATKLRWVAWRSRKKSAPQHHWD